MDRRVLVTTRTRFANGSITKQFTAAAILKLQEQGKLSIQDKSSRYFPSFPQGDEITLPQLLSANGSLRFEKDDSSHVIYAFARMGAGPEGRAKRRL